MLHPVRQKWSSLSIEILLVQASRTFSFHYDFLSYPLPTWRPLTRPFKRPISKVLLVWLLITKNLKHQMDLIKGDRLLL